MKLKFDIPKSLKEYPPTYPKGVNFKGRVEIERSSVDYREDGNMREKHIIWSEIPPIKDSFIVNGWAHSEKVPTIKKDPDNDKRYIGLSGFHRNAAAEQLGIEVMMYDVLTFDSPLDELKWATVSNHRTSFGLANTKDDIVKQTIRAIEEKMINSDVSEIRNLIAILAADKTQQAQKDILKKVTARTNNIGATILSYHTKGGAFSTQEFAEKFNIPCGGTERYEQTKRIGYISGILPKTSLYDGKILAAELGIDIDMYFWIENPKPGELHKQRKEFTKRFNEFIEADCLTMQHIAKQSGVDIDLKTLIKNHPMKLRGFLAQDISPDPFNGGKPKEYGVVDMNGNHVAKP